MYAGVKIIEDASLVDAVGLDWSGCRSPSRAKRRSKYGHRQRVKTAYAPKNGAFSIDGGRTLFMHPVAARELAKGMAQREAGTATVTDQFPDTDTPQMNVKDWVREMMEKRAEAGMFLPIRSEAVVKTEGVA